MKRTLSLWVGALVVFGGRLAVAELPFPNAEGLKAGSNGQFGEAVPVPGAILPPSVVDASAARAAVTGAAQAALAAKPEQGLKTKDVPAPGGGSGGGKQTLDGGPRWIFPWVKNLGSEESIAGLVSIAAGIVAMVLTLKALMPTPEVFLVTAGVGLIAGLALAFAYLVHLAKAGKPNGNPLAEMLFGGGLGAIVGALAPMWAAAWASIQASYWSTHAILAALKAGVKGAEWMLGKAATGIATGYKAGNRAMKWVVDKLARP